MALVIDLKPNERIIVGEAVIRNDKHRTRLHIDGDTPILREKDILKEEDANSPCQRIYLAVQLMYLSKDPKELHKIYFDLVREVQEAAPSTIPYIMVINEHILRNNYYKALKASQNLIDYETEIMNNV
jgi:flagellar protein FlbT